jgi:hypothetical protein
VSVANASKGDALRYLGEHSIAPGSAVLLMDAALELRREKRSDEADKAAEASRTALATMAPAAAAVDSRARTRLNELTQAWDAGR